MNWCEVTAIILSIYLQYHGYVETIDLDPAVLMPTEVYSSCCFFFKEGKWGESTLYVFEKKSPC